jgi:hypothetical protein
LVKLVIGSALLLITYIFNSLITSGSFPTEWRISKVIPVAKIPDPLELEDSSANKYTILAVQGPGTCNA